MSAVTSSAMSLGRRLFVVMLWALPVDAQFTKRSGPCVELPEPGSFLETRVVSRAEPAAGGVFRYSWRLIVGPASRRTIMNVSIGDAVGQFTAPPNWAALTSSSRVDGRGAVMFSSRALDDAQDLRSPNSYEFRALSDRLPGVALMVIYPRRDLCEPRDEDWPMLEKKGWTREKLDRLHAQALNTNREIVIAPVYDASDADRKPWNHFALAMKGLTDLEEFLSSDVNAVPARKITRPPQNAGELEGATMERARQRAIERAGSRAGDVAIIEALYRFSRANRSNRRFAASRRRVSRDCRRPESRFPAGRLSAKSQGRNRARRSRRRGSRGRSTRAGDRPPDGADGPRPADGDRARP
jgi:hypothetical protein